MTGVTIVARPNPAGTVSAAARRVAIIANTMNKTSMHRWNRPSSSIYPNRLDET
jgi:hypothetical protein